MGMAAQAWADALAAWAIPDAILAAAPESPWCFPPEIFAGPELPSPPDTPSYRRAYEALPDGGTVLDVGAGGGAASLVLVPPAGRIVAVDESEELLRAFSARAAEVGVAHDEVVGTWPDVAAPVRAGDAGSARIPAADVVVCHHVFYNVAPLAPFATALTRHARRRVVVELSAVHPLVGLNHLWRHFHGIDRPEGPGAEDAVAVLAEAGIPVEFEWGERPPRRPVARAARVAFVRRRLCLPATRDPEIDALLGDGPDLAMSRVATLWWPGGAATLW